MSRKALTSADVEQRQLAVVGSEGIEPEDASPDPSWGLERLVAYAKAQLTISDRAEQESLLLARKSAVALFRAGCALYFIRVESKSKGRGEWTKLKQEQGWKDTTANDASGSTRTQRRPTLSSAWGSPRRR